MKKNSAGRLHALSIDGCLGVVAQVPKTTSTYLHLYMYRNSTVEHVQLDSISGRRYVFCNVLEFHALYTYLF